MLQCLSRCCTSRGPASTALIKTWLATSVDRSVSASCCRGSCEAAGPHADSTLNGVSLHIVRHIRILDDRFAFRHCDRLGGMSSGTKLRAVAQTDAIDDN